MAGGPAGPQRPGAGRCRYCGLLALGAARIDIGQGDAEWVVMADPEGNEFCVLAHQTGW